MACPYRDFFTASSGWVRRHIHWQVPARKGRANRNGRQGERRGTPLPGLPSTLPYPAPWALPSAVIGGCAQKLFSVIARVGVRDMQTSLVRSGHCGGKSTDLNGGRPFGPAMSAARPRRSPYYSSSEPRVLVNRNVGLFP
jgi:hypothetical protein